VKNSFVQSSLPSEILKSFSAIASKPLYIAADVALHLKGPMFIDPATFNDITRGIIASAIEVHRTLGPGLLESTYLQCLHYELGAHKLRFVAQRAIPIVYKGMTLDANYRIDLIVEDQVVVEVKSVQQMVPVYKAQVLTYLRLANCPVGLLINFNVPRLVDGVKRLINARTVRGVVPKLEGVDTETWGEES
jgi:GxxExxY protein